MLSFFGSKLAHWKAAAMNIKLAGMLVATVLAVPAWAGGGSYGGSGGDMGGGGSTGGGTGGMGTTSATSASSASTANGGAGGAGGTGTGGAATGGSATGGSATGGAATGGKSSANGNTSNVTVSLTTSGSGASTNSTNAAASDPSSTGANTVATVDYTGSYTVKSAPPVQAPSLTSTFSDTCMGSSSFGLSFVGFGATGGTTMVDEACVRRLDSREFRAMGLNDVALALLCQSPANRKAVESAGHVCPSGGSPSETVSATATVKVSKAEQADDTQRTRVVASPIADHGGAAGTPQIRVASTEAVHTDAPELRPINTNNSDNK